MKINSRQSGYAHHLYNVTLENAAEHNLTDTQLITACDNGGFEDTTVRHFGGEVIRSGNRAIVKIYID